MAPPPAWALPHTGFIVENIACGFLVLTNNSCGILDFYLSNPTADKFERDETLREITTELMDSAGEFGVKMIMFNTQHKSIEKLGLEKGFKADGLFSCFSKEI